MKTGNHPPEPVITYDHSGQSERRMPDRTFRMLGKIFLIMEIMLIATLVTVMYLVF